MSEFKSEGEWSPSTSYSMVSFSSSIFSVPNFRPFHSTPFVSPIARRKDKDRTHQEKVFSYLAVGDSGSYNQNPVSKSDPTKSLPHSKFPGKKSQNIPVFFLPKHCTLGTEAMVIEWPLSVVERGSVL